VSGWQVLALKSAREAAIPVRSQTTTLATSFFATCEDSRSGITGYGGALDSWSEATTGVGMLVHEFLLKDLKGPQVTKAAEFLASMAEERWGERSSRATQKDLNPALLLSARGPFARERRFPTGLSEYNEQVDYYLWYNCTLAMFQVGGTPWERWNAIVRDAVIAQQEHGDRCVRGSWPPNDQWSPAAGRICNTAWAVLTLEVYYRFAKEGDHETQ
jgi:hypothetical protein